MKQAFLISVIIIAAGTGLLALVWQAKGLLATIAGTAGIIIGLIGFYFLANVLSNYINAKVQEKKDLQKKS